MPYFVFSNKNNFITAQHSTPYNMQGNLRGRTKSSPTPLSQRAPYSTLTTTCSFPLSHGIQQNARELLHLCFPRRQQRKYFPLNREAGTNIPHPSPLLFPPYTCLCISRTVPSMLIAVRDETEQNHESRFPYAVGQRPQPQRHHELIKSFEGNPILLGRCRSLFPCPEQNKTKRG